VMVDVIQLPLFPEFPVPPEQLPEAFQVHACPSFLNYAQENCPIYVHGGGDCAAPTPHELSSICGEAFNASSLCSLALSQPNSIDIYTVCEMLQRTCRAHSLLPPGATCAARQIQDSNCTSSREWTDKNGNTCLQYDVDPSLCHTSPSVADARGIAASHACCACNGSSSYICLPGWSEADGSCFRYNDTGVSFEDGDTTCQTMVPPGFGSRLATISSISMNRLVAELVGPNSEVFIGLKFIGFGGWTEGFGSTEWVSGFPSPSVSFESRWAYGNKTDATGECTRIFGTGTGVHAGAWDDHGCEFASQGFVCSYVPMVTEMLGGGALRTSKWWHGGTVEFTHLSIENLTDSMTPSSSFQPSLPTFSALIRFRLEMPNAIFYAGHVIHFVLAKELDLTPGSVPGGQIVAGNGLPSFALSLVDLDGGLVYSTDTPIVATLLNQDGGQHPMLGSRRVKVYDKVAVFSGLSIRQANASLSIRFSYAAQVLAKDIFFDTATFAVLPSDPHHLSVSHQPVLVTAGLAFQIGVLLQDEFNNVCLVNNAKVYAHTCTAVDPGCSSIVDAPLFSSRSVTRCTGSPPGHTCSYPSLAAGTWDFDHLVIKKAASGIRIFFGVEKLKTSFPFNEHSWWIQMQSSTTISHPLEVLRGALHALEFVEHPITAMAGIELPAMSIRLTDAEGNDHDPAAPQSAAGTPFPPSQVGNVSYVHLRLETSDGHHINTSSLALMDDYSTRSVFTAPTSLQVQNLFFSIANFTIFRAGTYTIHLRMNDTEIVGRSLEFTVRPAGSDRLLLNTSSGEAESAASFTAGSLLPLRFHVVDKFGNDVVDLEHCVTATAAGSLAVRAPWLEQLPRAVWIEGQTVACSEGGFLEFNALRLTCAGTLTLSFTYLEPFCRDCVRTVDVRVTASTASHISYFNAPSSFKIDDENLASLPGMLSLFFPCHHQLACLCRSSPIVLERTIVASRS